MGAGGMADASAGGDHRAIVPRFSWVRPYIVGHHLAIAWPHVVADSRCSLHSGHLLVNGWFPDLAIWNLFAGSYGTQYVAVYTVRTATGIRQHQPPNRNVDRTYIRRIADNGFMPCRGVYRGRYWCIT